MWLKIKWKDNTLDIFDWLAGLGCIIVLITSVSYA